MSSIRTTFRGLACACVATAAAPTLDAQVLPVASESFDYPHPGLLLNQNGGTGWLNPWFVDFSGNEIVIFQNNAQNPFPFPGDDGIGNYAGQALEFAGAFRMVDPTGHGDVAEANGLFGKDGATMWFSFTSMTYQQFGDHYNGFSLFEQFVGEKLFIGSPWASYGWGIDDQTMSPDVIANTDDSVSTRIVTRIDYMAGSELIRVWLDPAVPHPTSAPDLATMIPDHRWNEIRLSSGGNASQGYWDGLVIEKGVPLGTIGSSYCGPAIPNSTGNPGFISATGSAVVASNDVTLMASGMPANQFGYFLNSMTQGFVQNPGGSQGNLCLGGQIGRYNGQIFNSGASGTGTLMLDLPNTPTPSGSVSILAGETWNFTCWYRDNNPGPTSNFTDGVVIGFL